MDKSLVRDYIIEYKKKKLPWILERELKVEKTKRRIISIIGPRRAGKTYYFYQLIKKNRKDSLYLNFEDTRLLELNFREIRELLRIYKEINGREPEYLFLDEIQNIPKWESALREILDLDRYYIFITGSSSKLLSKEIATSLRGRTLTYNLLPFSFSEFLKAKNISSEVVSKDEEIKIKRALREYLEFGGFPEVVFEKEKDRILKEFYDLILFRDIVERHNLRNISLAKFLLSYCTQNFAKEISINKILNFFKSQGKKFGKNTLYDYIDKIQDSVAIFFLQRFSEKIYSRESWPKKIYLCDNGISRVVRFQSDVGKLMENAVFLEILRKKNENPLIEIYYYKNSAIELDFLLKEGTKVSQLIQVSYDIEDIMTKKREIKSLIKVSEEVNCSYLLLITWDYESEEEIKGKKIKIIPLWKWLLEN